MLLTKFKGNSYPLAVPAKRSDYELLPGAWLVAGLGISLIALASLLMKARMTIDPFASGDVLIYVSGLASITVYLTCRHGNVPWRHRARDISEFFGLFMAIGLLGAIASYPLAAAGHGFADAKLHAIDLRLGFNWIGWYEIVASHPLLQQIGRAAYQTIFVTPAVILAYLGLHGRKAEARVFIVSFWFGALLTLLLFSLMPAEGPLVFLWRGPIPYMPVSGLYQAELIPLLRDRAFVSVNPSTLKGLVCAPSFHAASAILYIAAGWRCGVLRWPIIAVNCAMLLATPVEGTHYFIDLIGGVLVALVALRGAAVVRAVARWRISLVNPPKRVSRA
jgi:hypothetical protein